MEQFLWILAGMAVSGLVAYLISHGYNLRNEKAVTDKLEEHSGLLNHQQEKLDAHMANSDAHWTPRERESLTKQIDRIDNGVQTLLTRFGGDLRQ